ncbi:hypothetical protein PR003_g15135 [Phytophthora rubi]|uniref:RxLR effector protein n=1 Tax=Phytophthora rubi TaxID=129364 RepID=A0A6A4F216_9STRA|nr:hypothetical protein PR001_g31052 [Phytophthora rubi]KAE8958461.1 hypothetical protein PR002_g30860 [Phytophthora rubi]KAE9331183.1 hypothetical protein PR003_g15135 [Phytophthora rubi]
MQLRHVVLIAVATLFSSADVVSAATHSKLVVSDYSVTGEQNVAPKRLLRADNTAEEDDEERAFNIKAIPGLDKIKSIPGIQKFSGLFKTKITPETLQGWAKKGVRETVN